jgi:hypothetical protein
MAWTRTVAQEWAKYRITVNSVVPAIWTPMYDAWRARMSDQERMIHDMAMQHVIPVGGKLGDPDADCSPVMVLIWVTSTEAGLSSSKCGWKKPMRPTRQPRYEFQPEFRDRPFYGLRSVRRINGGLGKETKKLLRPFSVRI